ncbi:MULTISPECIES: efflux RND transporter permease subunit [Corallococcus]|uniref:efflux RND transporter permease subunit n=1 Tax=Corallococcus TaxID=83461 RepID=UPI001F3A0EA7|nr:MULTISPECIES: efflux RND transporter permease subunit [Corallococcus]
MRSVVAGLVLLGAVAVAGPLLSYRSDVATARSEFQSRMTREARVYAEALAIVIVSGTLSACALTLVLLPVLFRIFACFTEQVVDRMPAQLLRVVPGAKNLRKAG